MRQLLYVPIIHEGVDLGSAGEAISQQSVSLAGTRRWAVHQEVVRQFWEAISTYLKSLDSYQLKIYQDGLPTNGAVGKRIVEEAARRGSRNYQLILELLANGAELRKTEDPILLAQERNNVLGLLRQPLAGEGLSGSPRYRLERDRLLAQRDEFIAQAINTSMREGELGVLFIGAHHDVIPLLAEDILVTALKEREKVQAYLEELLLGHDDHKLKGLGQHLTSPILTP